MQDFQTVLKTRRTALKLTQQQLADQLHVTRQTLSRWENGSSYPNLDTLVELSKLLNVSLDGLLKGVDNSMVAEISADVRDKRKYKWVAISLVSVIGFLCLWLGILGYGRATQNERIDYVNPFLKTTIGYAILPAVHQAKGIEADHQWIAPTGKVDAQVMDDSIATSGDWLKFYTGQYTLHNRYAIVKHKGSYVEAIRLIPKSELPLLMRGQLADYVAPNSNTLRVDKRFSFWPFN